MVPFLRNIATGCMEFLVTKHPAHVTGHAGMVRQLNNYASEDFCTMKTLTAVIGQKMWMAVKNTVSIANYQYKYLKDTKKQHFLNQEFVFA